MGSYVCAPLQPLNRTISGKELGRYKWYQILISHQKCASGPQWAPMGVDSSVPHRLERERKVNVLICKTLTQCYRDLFLRA